MWTEEAVRSYVIWGSFFTVTGILGIIAGLFLFFKAIPAVAEDNRAYLRKVLAPIAILGLLPSPGLVICGIMLLLVWRMYTDERFDLFGLLLEDVGKTRRPVPLGAPVATGQADARDAYATGYQEQSLYTDDYAGAQYGGGEGSYYSAPSIVDSDMPSEEPAGAPAGGPATAPMCQTCGKATEWIEEYERYYCYDCDSYV
jgi:hypothetical protein